MILWFQKNLYLAIFIALLLAALGVESKIIMAQSQKLGAAKAEIDGLVQKKDQLALNLDSKSKYAEALRVSLEKALATIEVGGKAQDQALAGWKRDYLRAVNETNALRKQRDDIYAQPGCKELADLDIAAACPAAAASLRQRAGQMSAPRDGRSPSP